MVDFGKSKKTKKLVEKLINQNTDNGFNNISSLL